MINDPTYRRRYVISGIAVVVVLVYIVRLFYLQVIDQSTKDQADNNALVKQTIYPSRGLIYDRNGELLVFNQPIYEITMVMREMKQGWDTAAFCACLGITDKEFDERIAEIKDRRKNRGYSRWTPQVFMIAAWSWSHMGFVLLETAVSSLLTILIIIGYNAFIYK